MEAVEQARYLSAEHCLLAVSKDPVVAARFAGEADGYDIVQAWHDRNPDEEVTPTENQDSTFVDPATVVVS